MTELGSSKRQPVGVQESPRTSAENEKKEAIANLAVMFPNLSRTELSNALEANSYSVQRTVDYILSEKSSSSPAAAAEDASEVAARIAQVEEDERLARALQSAYERENNVERQTMSRTSGDSSAAQPPLLDKLKLYGRAAKAKFWELYESYLGDGSSPRSSAAGVQPVRWDGYSAIPNTDEAAVTKRDNSDEFQGSTLLRRHGNQGENLSPTYGQAFNRRTNMDGGDGKKDK
ncbi:hypothetical protein GAYE_SCF12G3378 [Galdieria yellowstonensis]|uniref:CUE domain-containing protein n=1 Tax=Galdieria yellowstonensis TaxID=3028027 RepID=A0AAV9IDL8_9RHOD|nr:hypothetical protein GAYE_SCF12G3378 [Galdieria yellowstonensis]